MSAETHFGFEKVEEDTKTAKVRAVFDRVAGNYDLMNDLMSAGLHRAWKAFAVTLSGTRTGDRVLDVAAGSGDLSRAFARRVGSAGQVWATDINGNMLAVGRNRLIDDGKVCPAVQCDAEKLPFPDGYFDCVSVAFGLRNMTRKETALAEMTRVLRPGGRLLVLEFSKVWKPLEKAYDLYSFRVLPWLGERIAKDGNAYRYLAESIRMHPDQDELKRLMERAGLERVEYFNLAAGIVALHRGYRV